jgi:metal-responsive CopG/Arc/MetJ family transcriptional regulator
MKTITVNVSETVYEEFQQYAKRVDRKAAELIREAMEMYRRQHIQRRTSLKVRRPAASVGGSFRALGPDDDLLGEMLDDSRD